MKRDDLEYIEKSLRYISNGGFKIEQHLPASDEVTLFTEHFRSRTTGKGKIAVYHIFPGIEIAFNVFLAEQVSFHHPSSLSVLEINHCRTGRVGWNMKNGTSGYLGTGDLALHSMACCADSVMQFPVGYYEGISISVDLKQLEQKTPDILKDANISIRKLYQRYCSPDHSILLPSQQETEYIFALLYDLPESLRIPYFKLKVQELLLFLSRIDPKEQELTQYGSGQTELIKEVHQFLIHNLHQRYTINELSKRYLINTSSLKEIFKAVYGMPIATYMKEYRMKTAASMLRKTNDNIAQIAASVGYGSQSKFSNAFRDIFQVLPTEYRKQYQSQIPRSELRDI